MGWVPVDASEASKNPARRDYFFAAVDADRVMFTYGSDIHLSNEQKGEPLFIYPYAESNGQPVQRFDCAFCVSRFAGAWQDQHRELNGPWAARRRAHPSSVIH
ncbi:MAG TPA: hypothetical protein VM781_00095 [Candidatus Bathyarchaeia archaeon]|nr:hypothetical protein [Candidatus Bathyarchaeia archaeon]